MIAAKVIAIILVGLTGLLRRCGLDFFKFEEFSNETLSFVNRQRLVSNRNTTPIYCVIITKAHHFASVFMHFWKYSGINSN